MLSLEYGTHTYTIVLNKDTDRYLGLELKSFSTNKTITQVIDTTRQNKYLTFDVTIDEDELSGFYHIYVSDNDSVILKTDVAHINGVTETPNVFVQEEQVNKTFNPSI